MAFDYDIFDIMKREMKGDYNYFLSLSDEEIKKIPPFVVMKWLANPENISKQDQMMNLLFINNCINTNVWRSKDNRLTLLSMIRNIPFRRHTYIGRKKVEAVKQSTAEKKKAQLRAKYPQYTDTEFDMFYEGLSKKDLEDLFFYFGF